ncbi:MAG: hypothetical protein GWM90_30130, partial [Gemmatimonadetes bacterium]|nr:hypothetical protein [Gemmatimonadota bacterium]NIQ59354.1 hypothetical protein [Gemmatimonadota bacterium]NIU79545.1 hypothetical protein [Gammaproteobacteria bacterium]NIX48167.1 hypothetical protein [Gemmatimonadota bacterium]NIY12559.1 hypothetical protein [Gemmatimonadota bacterium]
MKRGIAVAALAVLTLAGCSDVGLAGNVPLTDAMRAPPPPLVAQVHPPREAGHAGVMLGGSRWVDSGLPLEIPARDLREVGAGHGHALYALRWDEPPFDRIYTRMPDGRWQG